jgi:hypothetical protein
MRVPSWATRWRVEIDEVVLHAPRQGLGHELAEHVTVVAAEVVEAVIGDCAAAAQPAVGGVELDEPHDLATRADAVTGGIDPAPREDLLVGGGCAGDLAAGADAGVEPAQIGRWRPWSPGRHVSRSSLLTTPAIARTS